MSVALYNEIEPFAAEWLERLVDAGHIAPGYVDMRSIVDLKPTDVAGRGQRHFFAGIGGWSYALRLAGIPDDADIWTGSCPCQPFSSAGARRGTRDPRHLWPAWLALIEQCRPAIVFGEQVASRDGLVWLDVVYTDLERCGYAVGSADLCAASVGAPHIRQRLYFMAYANEAGRGEFRRLGLQADENTSLGRDVNRCGPTRSALADASGHERGPRWRCATMEGRAEPWRSAEQPARLRNVDWRDVEWLACTDGVARPVEPGLEPLAHGVSGRVAVRRADEATSEVAEHWYNRCGALAGFGNAIVSQLAAAFIEAAIAAIGDGMTPVSKFAQEQER